MAQASTKVAYPRDVNGMGQLGMGQIPSRPTGMGWDWDSKIIISMGWDGTGTNNCGMGWDCDDYLWDSGMGQNVTPRDFCVPKKYYFQTD